MKKSKFMEAQIAYALRQSDSGVAAEDICRQTGIFQAAFYAWKKKYAALGVTELRRLRTLEEENARLKRVVADLTLDKNILQEVIKKKIRNLRGLAIRCNACCTRGALMPSSAWPYEIKALYFIVSSTMIRRASAASESAMLAKAALRARRKVGGRSLQLTFGYRGNYPLEMTHQTLPIDKELPSGGWAIFTATPQLIDIFRESTRGKRA